MPNVGVASWWLLPITTIAMLFIACRHCHFALVAFMTACKVRYFLFRIRKIGIFIYSWEMAYCMSWNEVRHCIAVSWISSRGVLLWGMRKHIHGFNAQPLRLHFRWSWKIETSIYVLLGHIWCFNLKVENVASWEAYLHQHGSRATCSLCHVADVPAFSFA